MKMDERGPVHAYVLTGNGVREHRILEAAVLKFNHTKILKIPQTGLGRPTGLEGVTRALAEVIEKVNVRRFLILIDKEHVTNLNEVLNKLRSHGFEILRIEELDTNCWRIKARRGHREAILYLAVLGIKKSIEENLAKLIEITHYEQVEPAKETVYGWLRRRGIRDKDLIQQASKKSFRLAFPQLAKALEELANDE